MASLKSEFAPFLFLDAFPEKAWRRAYVMSKVVLKEGFYYGEWRNVLSAFRPFGSVVIPDGLLAGVTDLGVDFARNDFTGRRSFGTVVCFKNSLALKWAIEQKRRGRFRKLIAGPFISTLPWESDELLLDPAVDGLLFLSPWHRDLFRREATRRVPPAHIWFSGVDVDYWAPRNGAERSHILVYKKVIDEPLFRFILSKIESRKIPYRVFEYGFYKSADYREALMTSRLAIYLSQTETQGLASLEAWSCDVPTIHLDPGVMNFLGKDYPGASSCPYLTSEMGRRFSGAEEFASVFEEMCSKLQSFNPRRTVLEKFTRLHSAQRFLQILEEVSTHENPRGLRPSDSTTQR